MKEYHKIFNVFKRDTKGNLIEGEWAFPEFEYLCNNIWEFTEKVDGTNIRIIWDGISVSFAGKTDNADIPVFLLKKLQEIFLKDEILEKFKTLFPSGACFYGEGYGAKIQKIGSSYRKDISFVLFDILVGQWWLKRDAIEEIAKEFNLEIVPIIKYGTLLSAISDCKIGFHSKWGNFLAEGYVLRPLVPLFNRQGKKIIVKLKWKDFKNENPSNR